MEKMADTSETGTEVECSRCLQDQQFLQRREPAIHRDQAPDIRLVDLFSGCGGLTLGFSEAARRVGRSLDAVFAIDADDTAADVYRENFPSARVLSADITAVFDGAVGAEPTPQEASLASHVGSVDVLVAGPPCQGHSDLNNHTRRNDPRNSLYLLAIRAAEVLRPRLLLIENVPAVLKDSANVVSAAEGALRRAGYRVDQGVMDLSELGAPQRRRRHFMLAAPTGEIGQLEGVLSATSDCHSHLPRSLRWAIGDLRGNRQSDAWNSPSRTSETNRARIDWLFQHDEHDLPNRLRPPCHRGEHTYRSMYGRLRWSVPAQTVTSGYGSMGQGRYVHPDEPRTLTPHEAARLQTFPDFFDFGRDRSRTAWARMIGNAVPPLVAVEVGLRLLPLLRRRRLASAISPHQPAA